LTSVEEIIAKLAEDIRRQKVGQQALNASAKLNQIELLAEETKLKDEAHRDRAHQQLSEQATTADHSFTLLKATSTQLADEAKVMFTKI
jgi:hypothetical protein